MISVCLKFFLIYTAFTWALVQARNYGRLPVNAQLDRRAGCNHDNCLRGLLRSSSDASKFCATYTLVPHTTSVAIPTYAAPCSGSTSQISSACSCLNTVVSGLGSGITSATTPLGGKATSTSSTTTT